MECIALSGIHQSVIDELRKGIPRTIELTSAHNVISIANVSPGNRLFMTPVDCEDLSVGDTGIIVEVLSIAISMKHLVEVTPTQHIMERERMSARIKVRFIQNTTIRATVNPCRLTEPRLVDIVRPVTFRAG